MNVNIGININLEKLIDSRMLIQAGSGGGKSYTLRKLLEVTNGKVQQLVLDPEGEFITLREKYDFALVSKGGDIPLNLRYAEMLAHKLLETNMSAIIDLYELKQYDRRQFVKRFLEALINAPKELWHSCMVVVDEAHMFAPETSKSESLSAVIDLTTRGRKRGFMGVLATQRLAKLHKDAAAECLNKLIGRTGLDIDRKRAAEELGMIGKQDILSLRDLHPGEFYGFGPAISNEVIKFKVSEVKTTHLQAGKRLVSNPPTPDAIKKIISKLANLPAEAEKELKTVADLKKENQDLRHQLKTASKSPPLDQAAIQKQVDKTVKETRESIERQYKQVIHERNNELARLNKILIGISRSLGGEFKPVELSKPNINIPKIISSSFQPGGAVTVAESQIIIKRKPEFITSSSNNFTDNPGKITGGAMRMLRAAAMYYPKSITRARMGALAGLSYTSGSFGTYLATLKRYNYITSQSNDFIITQEGLSAVGDVPPLPDDPESLIGLWCGIIKGGASRMLKELAQMHPQGLSREELGERAGISSTSGTFGTYLATLKRNGLIMVHGSIIKAADELFE